LTTSILVYIPCHTDFNEALDQAQRLREDFRIYHEESQRLYDRLDIIVSVNHFEPDPNDKIRAEELCDEVYYYGNALLADVNISQGFMAALRRKPDLFWLLSANDTLVEGSLIQVLREFKSDSDLDLVVANALGLSKTFFESEILNPQPIGYHYGLISGVVYRTEKIDRFFNAAPFFPWTGWSQLAVIQSAMNGNERLKISTLPVGSLFLMPEREIQHNAKIYAHSFLGGLIQTFVFEKSNKSRKKFLRHFVFKNFYLFHFFGQRDSVSHEMSELINAQHYLSWNQVIAESLIKSYTPLTYHWYKIFKQIPFEHGANNRILLGIKNRLKSHQ
jgi:hypothetical protein